MADLSNDALHLIICIALLDYSHTDYSHTEIDHSQAESNTETQPANFHCSDHNHHMP